MLSYMNFLCWDFSSFLWPLNIKVPQGLVLECVLFSTYSQSFGDLIPSDSLNLYADDSLDVHLSLLNPDSYILLSTSYVCLLGSLICISNLIWLNLPKLLLPKLTPSPLLHLKKWQCHSSMCSIQWLWHHLWCSSFSHTTSNQSANFFCQSPKYENVTTSHHLHC